MILAIIYFSYYEILSLQEQFHFIKRNNTIHSTPIKMYTDYILLTFTAYILPVGKCSHKQRENINYILHDI